MGTVTSMADFRDQRAAAAKPKPPTITRTPELALIMALYEELPRKFRGVALAKVMMMAERHPDCEASREAGRIACLLALKQEGK